MDFVMDTIYIALIVAIFRRVSGADSLLRDPDGQGRQVMNWVYWLSGIATLGIFVYLLIALFKPELFS